MRLLSSKTLPRVFHTWRSASTQSLNDHNELRHCCIQHINYTINNNKQQIFFARTPTQWVPPRKTKKIGLINFQLVYLNTHARFYYIILVIFCLYYNIIIYYIGGEKNFRVTRKKISGLELTLTPKKISGLWITLVAIFGQKNKKRTFLVLIIQPIIFKNRLNFFIFCFSKINIFFFW